MAQTKIKDGLIDASLGIDWQTTAKTAAFTAVSGEGYYVDTSSSAITVTLPASPSDNDEIIIIDYASNAGTNNITLGRNSLKIRGGTDDLVLNTDNQTVRLVYSGATKGWLVASEAGAVAAILPDLIVNYLVVAGGAGGGNSTSNSYGGAGGGAGGLRTSYTNSSSLNGHTESSLTLTESANYTVTVGGGGNSVSNGINSQFSTIISTGGGAGGPGISPRTGSSGGSGGGGGAPSGSAGNAITSPAIQGYAGGSGGVGSYSNAGGGGGANGVGAAGGNYSSAGQSSVTGGTGGVGLAVNIISTTNATSASVGEVSGSNVYFAGGGAGGTTFHNVGASGGLGGGADSPPNDANGNNGTPNTGGGGSGGSTDGGISPAGGQGGSGVVILRYPSDYTITVGSGITEASSSPFTEGSDKVSVFTAGTGTITFGTA